MAKAIEEKGRRKPLISVVMISYNGERLVGEAIESLLKQTDTDFEVVMVDDSSTDATLRKMSESREKFKALGMRCRIFQNATNRGTGYSWDRAARLAETPWICFLADDDLYMPARIANVKQFIEKNPDLEWLYHDAVVLKEATGKQHTYITPEFSAGKDSMKLYFKNVLKNRFIFHNSIAIRKEVYEKAEGFQELRGVEDFDFWMRLIEQGHLPKKMRGPPLFRYRSRGLDSSKFPYQKYYGAFTQSINGFLERNRGGDQEVVALAREFRIGIYIAYFMRCVRRGNFLLALKVFGGMVRKDF